MVVSLERSEAVKPPKKWGVARRVRAEMMQFAALLGPNDARCQRLMAARLWNEVRHSQAPLQELKARLAEWAGAELGFLVADVRREAQLHYALQVSRLGVKALLPLSEAERVAVRAALPVALPVETPVAMPVQSLTFFKDVLTVRMGHVALRKA